MRASGPRILIVGAGPNRIGQGTEFDYACVHAVFALREAGFDTVMVNSNPETVSTDYDTTDRLYFEPIALEDVLAVCEVERPVGVIVQFGGQTPLAMAAALERAGVAILGTSVRDLDVAEDRLKFSALLRELGIPSPPHGVASSIDEARDAAAVIGFPLIVRRPTSWATGHGDRVHGRRARGIRRLRVRGQPGACRVHRSLPGGCDRGRCRRGQRRPRDPHRRRHGAHRRGGRAFRRLDVHDPAGHAVGARARRHRADRAPDRPRPARPRTAQRSARRSRRRSLRAGRESAVVSNRAVRVEGHRPAAGEARRAHHGRGHAGRAPGGGGRVPPRGELPAPSARGSEGGGPALRPAPGH